jgi:hypothetical protein
VKYLKYYKLFESIEDGLSKDDVKNVFESYVNWNLISDAKVLCLEYLDEGLDLVILIKYNISKEDRQKNPNFYLVENVWSLDLSHEKEVSSWHLPSDNIYELEPIDSKSIEYFIYLRKDYDLQRNETVDIIESILSRYPNANINRVYSADNSQKRIVIGLDRRYSEPTNESQNFESDVSEIISEVEEIMIELKYNRYEIFGGPVDDVRLGFGVRNNQPFNYSDVEDTFLRMKDFMDLNGWKLYKITSTWQMIKSYGSAYTVPESKYDEFMGCTWNWFLYTSGERKTKGEKLTQLGFIFEKKEN